MLKVLLVLAGFPGDPAALPCVPQLPRPHEDICARTARRRAAKGG